MNKISHNNTENNIFFSRIPKVLPKSIENEHNDGKTGEKMIENIEINNTQKILPRNTPQQTEQNITPSNGVDVSINVDFEQLVKKAMLSQPDDIDKINIIHMR